MPEMELILIRHGETSWNRLKVFRGRRDVKLNAEGIAQADATAESLKDKVFDALYSSPLKRSLVTARRIASPHGMVIRESEGFSDISYGLWEGMAEEKVASDYPKQYDRWVKAPSKVRPQGGESMKKAWKRINSALREVLWTHGTGTVVIVSHRVPIKMMTAYLMGEKRHAIGKYKHDPCAKSVFRVQHRDYEPVVLNDSSHLAGLNLPEYQDF